MFRYSLLCVALLGAATQAHASSWADGLFDERTRDFGSVPRGQMLMHPFRIVNNTKQPVRIHSVRTSCHICSSASVLKQFLQPGEETAVIARMDTNRFIGTKTITVFVTFAQPNFEEARLLVSANSREDILFNPGDLAFGKVKHGNTPESKISITFLGAQTQILEAKSESSYVTPSLEAVRRPNGDIAFEITAKLRGDTPAGKWYTDIWLKTNNPAMVKLRVPVTVEVEAALTVNPSTISLGSVKAGTESDRNVIIRGVRPFRITGISGTDAQIQVRQASDESKAVHVLTVTLNPRESGSLSRIIRVQTDMKSGGDIEFNAQAEVVP